MTIACTTPAPTPAARASSAAVCGDRWSAASSTLRRAAVSLAPPAPAWGTRPSFGGGGSSAAGTLSASFKALPRGWRVTAARCVTSARSGAGIGGASSLRPIDFRRAAGIRRSAAASQTTPTTWRGPNGTST